MNTARIACAIALLLTVTTVTSCAQVQLRTDPPAPTEPSINTTIFPTDLPPSPTPEPEPIYLNLIWTHHQPAYATDPQTGLVTRPWVRAHATKDYYDMAAILQQYPKVRATFSFSPVLMKQLDDLGNGARDVYWELSARPAASLGSEDKRFILQRFFDANVVNMIGRFPRYKELFDKRGGDSTQQIEAALQSFNEQDFRDLQVWFNLAWFDPDFLAQSPLQELVAKGRDFGEEDKPALFNKTLEVVRGILPLHKSLQDNGQIEVATTPYAHPILPLLINTGLQKTSDPKSSVPNPPFAFPQDAKEQVQRSAQAYGQRFGVAPRGLWPADGAVATQVVPLVVDAGFAWMASGEHVLARSLDFAAFNRDNSEVAQQADQLYRPYAIETTGDKKIMLVFGDARLSSLIATDYSTRPGAEAAQDFVGRILRIRNALKNAGTQGPHLVTVVVDGASPWENYSNDGKDFLNALYQQLSDASDRGEIQTTTPSDYLQRFPEQQPPKKLWAGARDATDFGAWIGERNTNTAWQYLQRARSLLEDYLTEKRPAPPEAIATAYDAMLLAQGSDWFWHYGNDTDGDDAIYFDQSFRALLAQMYVALGVPVPEYVNVPIVSAGVAAPEQMLQGIITPTIDGLVEEGEWNAAGVVRSASAESPVTALFYGVNEKDMVVRVDANADWMTFATASQPARATVYFKMPGAEQTSPLSRLSPDDIQRAALGMNASHALEWTQDASGGGAAIVYAANKDGGWSAIATLVRVSTTGASAGPVLELSAPLDLLGGGDSLKSGRTVQLVVVVSQGGRVLGQFPINSVAQLVVP